MNDTDPRCPSCRAPQPGAVPGTTRRCVFCKHEFVVGGVAAPAVETKRARHPAPATGMPSPSPSPANASQASGASKAVAFIAAAMVALTCLGGMVGFLLAAPSGEKTGSAVPVSVAPAVPTAPVPLPGPPPTPANVAPAVEPTAELGRIAEGTTSIGGRFLLVEYRNTGSVRIVRPSVVASGFDANERRIVEQPGYALRSVVGPGETVVILVLIAEPPPELARVTVEPRRPESSGYGADELPVEVRESTERPTFGTMHELVGTVRNGNDRTVRFVRIVAVGRDDQGAPVAFADGMPSEHTLAPGAESGFDVDVGTFELRRPTQWEIIALGQPM